MGPRKSFDKTVTEALKTLKKCRKLPNELFVQKRGLDHREYLNTLKISGITVNESSVHFGARKRRNIVVEKRFGNDLRKILKAQK